MAGRKLITVEVRGGVYIVEFKNKKLLELQECRRTGEEISSLITEGAKVALDFSNIEHISSDMLGVLMEMDRKIKVAKGNMRMFGMQPDIYRIFELSKLNRLFDIREDLEGALEGL